MAKTESMMLELGTRAREFALPDAISGKTIALQDFQSAPALLVMFICNHCPFVIHVREGLVKLAKDFQQRGVAVVAISSNSIETHPDDAPDKMQELAAEAGFSFPYLHDESQEVAKAYNAACTPDFYLFDKQRRLVYRGQLDGSRPGNGVPVTGADLRAAVDAVLNGRDVDPDQKPSLGCNIKWKPGHEPAYATAVR